MSIPAGSTASSSDRKTHLGGGTVPRLQCVELEPWIVLGLIISHFATCRVIKQLVKRRTIANIEFSNQRTASHLTAYILGRNMSSNTCSVARTLSSSKFRPTS